MPTACGSWLATHDDEPMHALLWSNRFKHVHSIIDRRDFDRAEARLAELERAMAPGTRQLRALLLADRAALAEARGERDAGIRYRDEADTLRMGTWAASTERNYRQLVRVSLNGVTVLNREPLLAGEYRIRDVREGPDGFVYIATDNMFPGQPSPIVRLEPTQE